MRRLAGFALAFSALFLAIVAILSDAPALFYMGTALLATIGTARFQAYLSVRGLRFERFAPEVARIGERVKVEIVIWSEKNIRRPLIFVNDLLPPRFLVARRGPSLPIAPDFQRPVRTEYSFRPRRRGIYRWSGLEAVGTDALGLVSMTKAYSTDAVELTVLPIAIPLTVELPAAAGWGVSEASSGENKGPSGEPRGIREYIPGDSLRHVHWRTYGRTGQLHVKEFEAGSHSSTFIFLQRTQGTDLLRPSDTAGEGPLLSSLDLMCGQALHLSENLMRQGAKVSFPQLEDSKALPSVDRRAEIALLLAGIQANKKESLGEELVQAVGSLRAGSLAIAFLVRPDPSVVFAISRLRAKGIQLVALLYDASTFVDAVGKKPSLSQPLSRSEYVTGKIESSNGTNSAGSSDAAGLTASQGAGPPHHGLAENPSLSSLSSNSAEPPSPTPSPSGAQSSPQGEGAQTSRAQTRRGEGARRSIPSASESGYAESLREAGAYSVLVPTVRASA